MKPCNSTTGVSVRLAPPGEAVLQAPEASRSDTRSPDRLVHPWSLSVAYNGLPRMSAPNDSARRGSPFLLDSPPSQDERTWGMLAHLSAFVGLVFPLFGAILAPLGHLARLARALALRGRAGEGSAQLQHLGADRAGSVCGLLTCRVHRHSARHRAVLLLAGDDHRRRHPRQRGRARTAIPLNAAPR